MANYIYSRTGEILWRCEACTTYQPKSHFPITKFGRRSAVCTACIETRKAAPQSNTESFPLDAFVRGRCPMGFSAFCSAVWVYLRHSPRARKKCYAKTQRRGRHRLNRTARDRLVRGVWDGTPDAVGAFRLELCWALAGARLSPAAILWLGLRVLGRVQLRLASVGWAAYASRMSRLYDDPKARKLIDDTLFEVKQLAFSEGEAATLRGARQYAADLMDMTVTPKEFFPKSWHDAVMAVAATTLPSSYDAAFAALNWAYSSVHPDPPPPIPYPFVPGDFGKTSVDDLHDQTLKDMSRMVVTVAGDMAQSMEAQQTERLRREAEEVADDVADATSDLWD